MSFTPTQNTLKSCPKNYFIDLNEGVSTRNLTNSIFRKMQSNYLKKDSHKTINRIKTHYTYSLGGRSTPQTNFKNDSDLISANISSKNEERIAESKKIPVLNLRKIRQKTQNMKSYDFFNEKEKLKGIANSETKFSKTLIYDRELKTNPDAQISNRIFKASSLKKEDFLKTISCCMDFKDKNSFLIEILENKDTDIQIANALQNNSFKEFYSLLNNKQKNLQQLYLENYEIIPNNNFEENQEFFFDLLKILFKESSKIVKYYEESIKRTKNLIFDQNLKKRDFSQKESLPSDFISAIETLLKIHSPYNSENNINIEEIKEMYFKEYKLFFNKLVYEADDRIFHQTLTKLDNYLKCYDEVIASFHEKNEKLTKEIQALEKYFQENIFIGKNETKDLLDNQKNKTINTAFSEKNYLDLSEKYNDIIMKNMKKLEQEKEELQKQLLHFRKTSTLQEDYLAVLRKKNKKVQMVNKETQVLPVNNIKKISTQKSMDLQMVVDQSLVYYKYRDDDILTTINLILNEKLLADYKMIKENQRILPLNIFLNQWFTLKVSNYELSSSMIKDFLLNVKANEKKHPRCEIFLKLIGVKSEKDSNSPSSPSNQSNINENNAIGSPESKKSSHDFKSIFYSSSYACKILLQAAYFLRYSPLIDEQDPYASLFPNSNPDMDFQKIRNTSLCFKEILSQENIEPEIIEDSLREFQKFCNKFKINNNSNVPLSPSRRSSVGLSAQRRMSIQNEVLLIRFDHFMTFLLEYFAELFQKKIEHLKILLKLLESSRTSERVFIEDFKIVIAKIFPNLKNLRKEEVYLKFIAIKYESQIENLNLIVSELAKDILEGLQYESFYINEIKENNSNTKIEKHLSFSPKFKQDLTIFSHHNKANTNDNALVYTQNNPENYKIWNTFDKVNNIFELEYYDVVNSIGFINFIYDYIREMIKKNEERNDALYTYHEMWKKEFYRLPLYQGMRNAKKFSHNFSGWERNDLINRIQMNWNLIKLISDSMVLQP